MSSLTQAEKDLRKAEARRNGIDAEIAKLQKQVEYEKSFTSNRVAYVVTRHSLEKGTIQSIEGVFVDYDLAHSFASGLAAYGVGADIYIKEIPLYE